MTLPSLPSLGIEPPLPDSLQAEIAKSEQAFENQFPLILRSMIRTEGWLDKYRKEITRLVRLSYEAGFRSARERSQAQPANNTKEERQQQNDNGQ
jgi:hypothetical protein